MAKDGNINRHTMNDNIYFTPDGGLGISLINKTGATSVKGMLVIPDGSVDSAFTLVPVNDPDCMGVIYGDDDGNQVADGIACWIVISGIAKVLFQAATTRNHFARITITADADDAAGKAISEALPTSPFSNDKHFQEIGHIIEAIGGAGLALVVLHFD